MTVKPPAARGAIMLAGVLAISLCAVRPALAANNDDVAPANPALDGSLQTSEAYPGRLREAPVGTPEQSLWRGRPATMSRDPAPEPLPALGKPIPLLGEAFESTAKRSFDHPE